MRRRDRIKKELRRAYTILLIPHNSIRPFRLTFSLSSLLFLMAGWTGLTLWAGFVASRHVNYWKVKADQQVMKAKVGWLAWEMHKSREFIDQAREAELQLQKLLRMKSRQAIIESEEAIGGPSLADQTYVAQLLRGQIAPQQLCLQVGRMKEEARTVLAGFQEIAQHIQQQRSIYRATPALWPSPGRLTSRFGSRMSPFSMEQDEFHRGIDIANQRGTVVYATADGIVRLAGWEGGYGRLIVVDHGHGYQTHYAHNAALLVKSGEVVRRGQPIATMGTSGSSTGYHVHYEVWKDGHPQNPLRFVRGFDN